MLSSVHHIAIAIMILDQLWLSVLNFHKNVKQSITWLVAMGGNSALHFLAELLTPDGFWEIKSHCLQSYAH